MCIPKASAKLRFASRSKLGRDFHHCRLDRIIMMSLSLPPPNKVSGPEQIEALKYVPSIRDAKSFPLSGALRIHSRFSQLHHNDVEINRSTSVSGTDCYIDEREDGEERPQSPSLPLPRATPIFSDWSSFPKAFE